MIYQTEFMKFSNFVYNLFFIIMFFNFSAIAQFLPNLPKPSGQYKIGSSEFLLKDETRREIFSADKNAKREILVRVWYPAENVSKDAKKLPLWGKNTKQIGFALAENLNMPKSVMGFLALVPSNSYDAAPILETKNKFPVVVFSHGYTPGFLAQNTAQMEELASYGYVVFSVGHFYESIVNILPDGRTVLYDKNRRTRIFAGSTKVGQLYADYSRAKTKEEKRKIAKQITAEPSLTKESLQIWTDDMIYALDEIERMNAGKSIFKNKLDLEKIGIMGMSFGGATAGQLCLKDARCKAGISLDGFQFGDTIAESIEKPFMFLQAETGATGVNRDVYEDTKNDGYFLVIDGAKHQNFTDFSIFASFDKNKNFLGKIDGIQMEKIMNTYILAFFDKYVRGKDSDLLDKKAQKFEEVEFFSHK